MKPATSIEKMCRVFDSFRSTASLGITEVSEKTGLLRSDVHRILRSLEHFGYIAQDSQTKKYQLGLELLKLGHLVHRRLEVREIARPFMRQLSDSAEATANLALFDAHDLEIIFVEQIDSPAEVQIRSRIGKTAAPHATSLGKVLLAYLDSATVGAVLKKHGLPRITKHTITSLPALERELETVRRKGWAVDHEEALEGAWCIGAPVRNYTGDVVAAVSISKMMAHVARQEEPRIVSLLKTVADGISKALGYGGNGCAPTRRDKPLIRNHVHSKYPHLDAEGNPVNDLDEHTGPVQTGRSREETGYDDRL
jgi:DNA-binding IclR family transcriptional regulator